MEYDNHPDFSLEKKSRTNQSGQALITLLFFTLIATIYITAAIVIMIVNSEAATRTEQGISTSRLAEGALEDTFLRLIRDPNYSGGSFNLEDGNATVNITGTNPRNITVSVQDGSYFRRYQAEVQFNQTEMTILSWKELF